MKADVQPARLPRLNKRERLQRARKRAAAILEVYKQQFEGGDGFALLRALGECADVGIPIPPWAAKALRERNAKFSDLECASLGDAFGIPDHAHLDSKRMHRDLSGKVWWRVRFPPIGTPAKKDKGFWDAVGRDFGVSGGTAKRLYYEKQDELGFERPRGKKPHSQMLG